MKIKAQRTELYLKNSPNKIKTEMQTLLDVCQLTRVLIHALSDPNAGVTGNCAEWSEDFLSVPESEVCGAVLPGCSDRITQHSKAASPAKFGRSVNSVLMRLWLHLRNCGDLHFTEHEGRRGNWSRLKIAQIWGMEWILTCYLHSTPQATPVVLAGTPHGVRQRR